MENTNFVSAIKKMRSEVAEIRLKGDWSAVLGFFRANDGVALSTDLLLLKAAAIQLADDAQGYVLEDAMNLLNMAFELAPCSSRALIEKAHFQFAVEDNAHAALRTFQEAELMCKSDFVDLTCGKGRVLKELHGTQAALTYLSNSAVADSEAVQALVREISSEQTL
ncbi:cell division protein ZapD [Roseateles sp. YR242]|uniref:cell division protein ZapD n=1 Tax=Roseateles sp. YR242 TaxID=1855305 RepID=UPI001160A037|nr:cell division protein ZapD [Roseateles sp. YR242]